MPEEFVCNALGSQKPFSEGRTDSLFGVSRSYLPLFTYTREFFIQRYSNEQILYLCISHIYIPHCVCRILVKNVCYAVSTMLSCGLDLSRSAYCTNTGGYLSNFRFNFSNDNLFILKAGRDILFKNSLCSGQTQTCLSLSVIASRCSSVYVLGGVIFSHSVGSST